MNYPNAHSVLDRLAFSNTSFFSVLISVHLW